MRAPRKTQHVIDTHHHVGELSLGMGDTPTTTEGAAIRPVDVHVDMLDSFEFSAAAVIPGFQYDRSDGIANTRSVNDAIARYRDSRPDRFPIALGTVEPLHREALCREEVGRMVEENHIDGLAWHTRYQGVALSDRRMHTLIDVATEHDLPCYVHMFYESGLEAPWSLLDLGKAHPDATFVALDMFSGSTQIRYLMDIAERCENILFDTAICFPLMRPLDEFVTRFGSHRLLFGTDSYAKPLLYNTPSALHELQASDMPQEDLENIMWRNFLRVFPQAAGRLGMNTDAALTAQPA